MNTHDNSWCQTFTGKQFFPFNPRVEDICIEDIAHHLSMLCRYTGATRTFYSVAEHSVWVSCSCSDKNALWGLLHDAAEAYLGDLARPIKNRLGMVDYRNAERAIMLRVCQKFNLAPDMPREVKEFDTRIIVNERKVLMADPPIPWITTEQCDPIPDLRICGLTPAFAEQLFLDQFRDLAERV